MLAFRPVALCEMVGDEHDGPLSLVLAIVRALLGGPAPYLRGAVTSAFPPGTTLARSAVPVRDGTATVELSVPEFDPANIEINRRMHEQLTLSLGALPSVDDVELSLPVLEHALETCCEEDARRTAHRQRQARTRRRSPTCFVQ